jgi:hypothetical protein
MPITITNFTCSPSRLHPPKELTVSFTAKPAGAKKRVRVEYSTIGTPLLLDDLITVITRSFPVPAEGTLVSRTFLVTTPEGTNAAGTHPLTVTAQEIGAGDQPVGDPVERQCDLTVV